MSLFFSRRGGYHRKNTPYRSGLEEEIAKQLKEANIPISYENHRITYHIPQKQHHYTPDFILPNGIIIETKGIFESNDRQKHLYIKQQYPHLEIRFIFSNPHTKIYKGSKTTYADWCKKHHFQYATKIIPSDWIKDTTQYSTEGTKPKCEKSPTRNEK